jgi:FAD/FMN-containing dehydrogenase
MLDLSDKQQVLVKIGGNSAAVAAQRAAMDGLGGARNVNPEVWDRLRNIEERVGPGDEPPIVIRISSLPQNLPRVWSDLHAELGESTGAVMHATPSLGIIRCVLAASTDLAAIQRIAASARDSTVIFERLPRDAWRSLSPTVVGDSLSQRVKKAFDPSNILNPGILGPSS